MTSLKWPVASHSSNSSKKGGIKGNTNQFPPCYRFCFTLNNYSNDEYDELIALLKNSSKKFIVGKEKGKENETPHLQGYVSFCEKKRLTELKKYNARIHWESCKGTEQQNIDYCSKENNFYAHGIKVPKKLKIIDKEKLYPWQKELIDIVNGEPDDRSIYWYYDLVGNMGKTTIAKYLSYHHGAVPVEGKKNDILYCCAEHESDIYIFDFERSMEEFVSYSAIEKIKNGYYMSSKYESKPIIRNPPHVIIFANFVPDYNKLSLDRWKIRHIVKTETTDIL